MIVQGEALRQYNGVISGEFGLMIAKEYAKVRSGKEPWELYYRTSKEDLERELMKFPDDPSIDTLIGGIGSLLVPFSPAIELGEYDFPNLSKYVGMTAVNLDEYILQGNKRFHQNRDLLVGNALARPIWDEALEVTGGDGFEAVLNMPFGPFQGYHFLSRDTKPLKDSGEDLIDRNQLLELYLFENFIKNSYRVLSSNGVLYSQVPKLPFEFGGLQELLVGIQSLLQNEYGCNFDFHATKGMSVYRIRKGIYSAEDVDELNLWDALPSEFKNFLKCQMCPLVGKSCRFNQARSLEDVIEIARTDEKGAIFARQTSRISANPDDRLRTITTVGFDELDELSSINCVDSETGELFSGYVK